MKKFYVFISGHGESYNPPPEYLQLGKKRFESVRQIPAWKLFVRVSDFD